ncbi:MAG: O-antigen ligase family protein [Gammaproteobacteria bacterium]|nr:O-antigen ligase family protein [Gammaproteobacteria bacterium]
MTGLILQKFFDYWRDNQLLKADRVRYISLMVLIFASLSTGIWQGLGIPLAAIKAITEVCILILLLSVFTKEINWKALILIVPLLCISFIGVCGALLEQSEGTLSAILFFRDMLKFALLLPAIASFKQRNMLIEKAVFLASVFFLIQPVISILKFFLIGVDESYWIGTMHQTAGELGVLAPLFAICFLVPMAFLRSFWWFTVVVAFCVFCFVNEKRLGLSAIPITMFGMLFLHLIQDSWRNFKGIDKLSSSKRKLYGGFIISLLSIFVIYASALIIPSLNIDEKVGGFFNYRHIISYHKEYLTRDYEDPLNNPIENIEFDPGIQLGRFKLINNSFRYMANQPTLRLLFGFGGSDISTSYLLGGDRTDIFYHKHQLRGATPFGLRVLIETGFVGYLIFVFWFSYISFLLIRNIFSLNESRSTLAICATGMHLIFFFDSLFYSCATWTNGVLTPIYFVILTSILFGNYNIADFLFFRSIKKLSNQITHSS